MDVIVEASNESECSDAESLSTDRASNAESWEFEVQLDEFSSFSEDEKVSYDGKSSH
jgi:hypothetical protein